MKKALISVTDKSGLIPFACALQEKGYRIVTTGGTYTHLEAAGIACEKVETVTGFEAFFEGRVKTLHPHIHGGILGKRSDVIHQKEAEVMGIEWIDLVVVNLYPFEEALKQLDHTDAEQIEQIDIGGVALLRSAAKNHAFVTVVSTQDDYLPVLAAMDAAGYVPALLRRKLAAKAMRLTAAYDAVIATYLDPEPFPERLTRSYQQVSRLRYGENPHQEAAFYADIGQAGFANHRLLHGKPLSYNNIQDAHAALQILQEYDEPCVVAVKHMNPCGIGCAESLTAAYDKAYEADPISIFGGIVALNQMVDQDIAEKMNTLFLEVILAPAFSDEALTLLKTKKNRRLILIDPNVEAPPLTFVQVAGGLLLQRADANPDIPMTVVTLATPDKQDFDTLNFAFKAVKHVKSNAIVVARSGQTIGIGAGQMNRVGAAHIALAQAGQKARGAVLASDAFFPQPDTVEAAAKAGIKVIIQPGGSRNDQASIDACNAHKIAMVFTHVRHFKH